MIKWQLVTRKVKDLRPNPNNPRKLTIKQCRNLGKSIDKFGVIEKPIINLDNEIIGGHQRINLLKRRKIKEIECWLPDRQLTEDDFNELCIRLNKNTGEWDYDKLANEWDDNSLLEWGFELSELGLNEVEEKDTSSEEDEEEDVCEACGQKVKNGSSKR